MRTIVTFLLLLAGCNEVYDLDRTTTRDAAVFAAPKQCDPPYVVSGDYDGDQLANLNDPCPTLADPASNADRDGDKIGDACDPMPDDPGDCIVMFEDFHATDPGCWELGAWTLGCEPGSQEPCSPAALGDTTLQFARLLAITNVQVSGEFLTATPGLPGAGEAVEVFLRIDERPPVSGHGCGAVSINQLYYVTTNTYAPNGGVNAMSTPVVPDLPFQPARVVVGLEPRIGATTIEQHCTVSVTTAAGLTAQRGVADVGFQTGGRFAIRAKQVRYRADLIVAYGRGRQCVAQ